MCFNWCSFALLKAKTSVWEDNGYEDWKLQENKS